MVNRTDYNQEAVEAAHSVLIELMHLLGEYRDHMVLIGGWVPHFLFPTAERPHLGSTDIDLALDHRKLQTSGYETIKTLLLGRGYKQHREQPFIFYRRFFRGNQEVVVQVDLLTGEYEGSGKSHRTQKVQDILARKVRGCDLAFDAPKEMTIVGDLPGGGKDSVTVRVASIVPFLVMKSITLDDRLKEKDAYDIYFCVSNFPGGVDSLADEFRPNLRNALVMEALQILRKNFSSPEQVGPRFVADFDELTDPEERDRIQRDVYEQINYLLEKLGIK